MDPINPITPDNPKPINPTIFLSILLILLTLSTLFLAYQNMQLQKQIATLNTPVIVVPSPTAAVASTANWKTYNFSPTILFKLPQDTKNPLYVNVGHYALETILHNHTILQIWGADGASPSGGKDGYDEIKKKITNNQIFQTKAIRLNNNEATEFISNSASSEMVWGGEVYQRLRGILVKMNDGRGLVIVHYTNQAILVNENFENDNLVFDQILSTFKFIERTFCGGFTGAPCPEGYECKYEPNSDGGYCIKN